MARLHGCIFTAYKISKKSREVSHIKRLKKYSWITQKDFDQVKAMQKSGIKKAVVAKILSRSYQTIFRIYSSGSFKEFKESWKPKTKNLHLRTSAGTSPSVIMEKSTIGSDTATGRQLEKSSVAKALHEINATLRELVEAWRAKPER